MSVNVNGIGAAAPDPTMVNRSAAVDAAGVSGAIHATGSDEAAVKLDTFPTSPPPEVIDAVGEAAHAAGDLAANGQQVHFGIDPQTGRFTAALQDLHGNHLSTLSPSQVLDLAGGESF